MNFLSPKPTYDPIPTFSTIIPGEHYIFHTKGIVDQYAPEIFLPTTPNLPKHELKSINKLKSCRDLITIKPADKNLGVVVLNTSDYLDQCLKHLSSTTYTIVSNYPQNLKTVLENTLLRFKPELTYDIIKGKSLFNHLSPSNKQYRTPRFYGLPKIHKPFKNVPPIRPIVSQTESLFSTSAKFLDYTLQPLAQSYPDYLHNSTHLINTLSAFDFPKDSLLLTLDIINLFPSIPLQECLDIIYQELNVNTDLLITNPNLIVQLLSIHMHNNFFEFANYFFHQNVGIAMGAAFSPTVANIFVSVFLRNFFKTQIIKPYLILRYIDDILIVWPKQENISIFCTLLNNFHPNIKFTHTSPDTTVNFLDVTITLILQEEKLTPTFKTFQKPHNLFQYLHYNSSHPISTFKGIVIGECVRYIRTNSSEESYNTQKTLFSSRLKKRGYPTKFIATCMKQVTYSNRNKYLEPQMIRKPQRQRPILKTIFPPQYKLLTKIILDKYPSIKHFVDTPFIIFKSAPPLRKRLVNAKLHPTDSQVIDIFMTCNNSIEQQPPKPELTLPSPRNIKFNTPSACLHPNCKTCEHYDQSQYFRSKVTKRQYRIQHPFSCSSTNVIYLITCKKCKKQYVGQTTTSVRKRLNGHRSAMKAKIDTYLYNHFNFPDHDTSHIKIQAIDTTTPSDLSQLEHYWILTLKTFVPFGLNLEY